jgi:hypothetical protein
MTRLSRGIVKEMRLKLGEEADAGRSVVYVTRQGNRWRPFL